MNRKLVLLLSAVLLLTSYSAGNPPQKVAPKYLSAIKTQQQFDALKRIYYRGRLAAIPHMMFVIDREKNKVYYVNSKLYTFHTDFIYSNYLSLERGAKFFDNNYLKKDRRFILGTVAFQPSVNKYTFEFWEGDLITADLIELTDKLLQDSFFQPLSYKPNSLRQEQESASLTNLPKVFESDIEGERSYEAINQGEAIGILRLIQQDPPERHFEHDDIVMFKQVPVSLLPISGVIMTHLGSPLSHINMLARGWNIPDVFIKDADVKYKDLVGRWVKLKAGETGYTLEPVDYATVQKRQISPVTHPQLTTPKADLSWKELTDLKDQHSKDVVRFGAKSANLGEVLNAQIPNIIVPPGFTIPFYYYNEFAKSVNLEDKVTDLFNDEKFHHDPKVRQQRLAELRDYLQKSKVNDQLRQMVLDKVHAEFAGKGLFARSSTNAEDLPNFNGAGLYTTVPNVKTDDQMIEAIKTVWASIWNFEAFEAREAAGIDHLSVYAAVFVQEGINADSAGVLITTNPFDKQDHRGVYINAKRGLGIKVVEGQKVPEQIIYRPQTNTVRVLTRSNEDTLLTFDDKGGVKEIQSFPDRAVLTDATARKLSRAALAIKQHFRGRDQDIEWVIVKDQVYIVQSRPYIE
ncbi:MAG TPA: PEP/pyruvate-binding domain-containing protein [Blastocatellia bacterium]|nr:PEP/pyruvate-binding domain-containing protein [Blastocatellia bacterium]